MGTAPRRGCDSLTHLPNMQIAKKEGLYEVPRQRPGGLLQCRIEEETLDGMDHHQEQKKSAAHLRQRGALDKRKRGERKQPDYQNCCFSVHGMER